MWRLRGPGHRACAVQHYADQVKVWTFLDAEYVSERDLTRLWLGIHQDAAKRRLPNPHITWFKTDSWDWPEPITELIVPQDVGERLTVVPAGRSGTDPARVHILLDGRYGFGMGGLHATTRLCLEALERRVSSEVAAGRAPLIADIGCGVGTLSLAAVLLGAARVFAVDTKAASVIGTTRNRELNDISPDRLLVDQGSVAVLKSMLTAPVDGFCCNILARIIVPLIPRFADLVGSQTWGILSGIREAEWSHVGRALDTNGWETRSLSRNDGWCCVEVMRQ